MASTYSTSLRLELIGQGEQSGTWGVTTNNNFGSLVEQAITGVQSISMANTSYTLSNFDGAVDEARNAVLVLTGTNLAPQDLIAPAVEKVYIINNQSGNTVTVKTSGGNGYPVLNNAVAQVYCNGTEFYSAAPSTSTVTGNFNATGNVTAGQNIVGVNGIFSGNVAVTGSITAASITGVTGRILQVVSSTFGSTVQTSSGTQIATGHTATITPTSTSSKVMVLLFGDLAQSAFGAGIAADAYINIVRNGGALFSGRNVQRQNVNISGGNTGSIYSSIGISFVDSPSSTAGLTYAVYYSADSGGQATYNELLSSTITLLEIL